MAPVAIVVGFASMWARGATNRGPLWSVPLDFRPLFGRDEREHVLPEILGTLL
jgi:hypothetical protein